MSQGDTTIYATGNGVKLDDLKAVLGQGIINCDLKPIEIQQLPIHATEDKVRRCFEMAKGADVCCEETSFGTGELATFIKQIIDACDKNGGKLDQVWKAVAPGRTEFDYTSIVGFKNQQIEAFFECTMKCAICERSGSGKIDPFAVPIQYTLVRFVKGVSDPHPDRTVLEENVAVDNPKGLSIAEQPEKRAQLHPRYFSLRAYKEWRMSSAPAVTLECTRDSVCMGDDCNAPNPKTLHVSSSLTDPVALGEMLGKDYLPLVAGTGLSWELQLNGVKFARVSYASEGAPVVEPLVAKCELLRDGSNAVYCAYRASSAAARGQ